MTKKYKLICFLEDERGDCLDEFEQEFSDEKEGMRLFNKCKSEHQIYVQYRKNTTTYFREKN